MNGVGNDQEDSDSEDEPEIDEEGIYYFTILIGALVMKKCFYC